MSIAAKQSRSPENIGISSAVVWYQPHAVVRRTSPPTMRRPTHRCAVQAREACCRVSSMGWTGSWRPESPDPDTDDVASHGAPRCHQRNLQDKTTTTTNYYYTRITTTHDITVAASATSTATAKTCKRELERAVASEKRDARKRARVFT